MLWNILFGCIRSNLIHLFGQTVCFSKSGWNRKITLFCFGLIFIFQACMCFYLFLFFSFRLILENMLWLVLLLSLVNMQLLFLCCTVHTYLPSLDTVAVFKHTSEWITIELCVYLMQKVVATHLEAQNVLCFFFFFFCPLRIIVRSSSVQAR